MSFEGMNQLNIQNHLTTRQVTPKYTPDKIFNSCFKAWTSFKGQRAKGLKGSKAYRLRRLCNRV